MTLDFTQFDVDGERIENSNQWFDGNGVTLEVPGLDDSFVCPDHLSSDNWVSYSPSGYGTMRLFIEREGKGVLRVRPDRSSGGWYYATFTFNCYPMNSIALVEEPSRCNDFCTSAAYCIAWDFSPSRGCRLVSKGSAGLGRVVGDSTSSFGLKGCANPSPMCQEGDLWISGRDWITDDIRNRQIFDGMVDFHLEGCFADLAGGFSTSLEQCKRSTTFALPYAAYNENTGKCRTLSAHDSLFTEMDALQSPHNCAGSPFPVYVRRQESLAPGGAELCARGCHGSSFCLSWEYTWAGECNHFPEENVVVPRWSSSGPSGCRFPDAVLQGVMPMVQLPSTLTCAQVQSMGITPYHTVSAETHCENTLRLYEMNTPHRVPQQGQDIWDAVLDTLSFFPIIGDVMNFVNAIAVMANGGSISEAIYTIVVAAASLAFTVFAPGVTTLAAAAWQGAVSATIAATRQYGPTIRARNPNTSPARYSHTPIGEADYIELRRYYGTNQGMCAAIYPPHNGDSLGFATYSRLANRDPKAAYMAWTTGVGIADSVMNRFYSDWTIPYHHIQGLVDNAVIGMVNGARALTGEEATVQRETVEVVAMGVLQRFSACYWPMYQSTTRASYMSMGSSFRSTSGWSYSQAHSSVPYWHSFFDVPKYWQPSRSPWLLDRLFIDPVPADFWRDL